MYAAKAARLRKNPVGLTPFVVFFSATFLLLLELLRNSFIATAKTSFTFARHCYLLIPIKIYYSILLLHKELVKSHVIFIITNIYQLLHYIAITSAIKFHFYKFVTFKNPFFLPHRPQIKYPRM
jgi:Na+/citrate or Na+/malate symporter